MPQRLRLAVVAPYFFPRFYGGAVQVYHHLVRQSPEFDVTIVSSWQEQDPQAAAEFDAVAPAEHGYRVVRVKAFEHCLEPRLWMVTKLWRTVKFFVSSWIDWRRILKEARPDIVICGQIYWQGWLMRALPPGTAYLNYIHGEELTVPATGPVRRFFYRQQFAALRRAHCNIVVSEYSARIARRISGAPERSFVVHPNFVDHERFRPPADRAAERMRLGWHGHFVFLCIARLSPRKGISHALRGLADAQARGVLPANWLYVIGGVGEQEGELRALTSKLGIESRVRFVGFVGDDELPGYYGAADVFLHPNRSINGDFEGFGLVFLEANACGTPVIGGLEGGSSDAIVDGETGLLVDSESISDISRAIEILARDAALREKMGQYGLKRASSEFTLQAARERFAQTLLEVHRSVQRQGANPE